VWLLHHCFLDEAADVRQAGVGSAGAARLDRRRVRIQANDAHALVRLHAGGGHCLKKMSGPTDQMFALALQFGWFRVNQRCLASHARRMHSQTCFVQEALPAQKLIVQWSKYFKKEIPYQNTGPMDDFYHYHSNFDFRAPSFIP
jgi:hypothetical protein